MMKYELFINKNNYVGIIIFLFILIIIKFIILIYIKEIEKIKVCLCTIGKEENSYIREFVSHYKKYNIDKIFIYDNNDIKGENFQDSINDYISSGFVEVTNIRGKISQQLNIYQKCLDNNRNKFDWLIFYDIDEFIYLKRPKNIKFYLGKTVFNKCQAIQLNMFFHTDNNQLYYKNKTLAERFTEKKKTTKGVLKSILKGGIKIKISCPHILNSDLISCDGFGNYNKNYKDGITSIKPDFYYYYIDHYSFKSTEEFIKKIMRGSAIRGFETEMKYTKISWYFSTNTITKKKIKLIEKYTNLNLSRYSLKIMKT